MNSSSLFGQGNNNNDDDATWRPDEDSGGITLFLMFQLDCLPQHCMRVEMFKDIESIFAAYAWWKQIPEICEHIKVNDGYRGKSPNFAEILNALDN